MKRIILLTACYTVLAYNPQSFAAQLCGKISGDSAWEGGVFSVIDTNGTTIATTNYIKTGKSGCTGPFAPGTYIIRFNGGLDVLPSSSSNEIYGCITSSSYSFDKEAVLTIVFNQGYPPFNGNRYCNPSY